MIVNKPPMGWNSWNTFGADINEEVVLQSAEALVSSGLAEAGYQYVVIDDCWSLKERDSNGRLVPDPQKFPHGMKYIADYIHGLGLKFGMYSCGGLITCGGYPSSLDREWIDAQTFAEWDVDYLKYDYCFRPRNRKGEDLYRAMGLALANCGRDIFFAACSWGADETHKWIRTSGADTWRSTEDIFDNWKLIHDIIQHQFEILPYGGKGCFNDMDMLIIGMNGKGHVGLGGCTPNEYALHFAAWCLFQSPLMIGCDVRNLGDETLHLLKNPMLIAINQDEKCAQTYTLLTSREWWAKDKEEFFTAVRMLSNGDLAIACFNLSDKTRSINCTLNDMGLGVSAHRKLRLKNCFTEEVTFSQNGVMIVELEPHTCVIYRAECVME